LTEHASWRFVFFVNLPVAVAALLMVWIFFPHIVHHEETDRSIDWLGAVLLLLAICGLLGSAEYSQGHGFVNAMSLSLWAAASILAYSFFRHQYHTTAPIVPPKVLDDSGARKLMLLGVLTGLTMFMLIFYTPLLLQGSFGQSPNQAGLVMTPLLVFITIGSIVNGRLLPRLRRAERIIAWGQLGMLISCLLLTQLESQTPRGLMMLVFALCGISLGFQLPNLTLQIMAVAGRANLGVAGALAQSTRMIGSMIGVGIASVLVNTLYAQKIVSVLDKFHIQDSALISLLSSPQILIRRQDQEALLELTHRLGLDAVPLMQAARDGLVNGTHAAFVLCSLISGISILISLRLPRYTISPARKTEEDQQSY
jgi:predicted MFS family arabinose efflux permease